MKVEQLSLFDMPAEPKRATVCLSVDRFSKMLASKGFNIGEIRLFAKLRQWKMIDKFNVPYLKYMRSGYFKTIQESYFKGKVPHVHIKILVTPNGQRYIEERLRNEANDNRS